jgi:hypothetical protein
MVDLSFQLVGVDQKPRRTFTKKNKYEPIITMFCERNSNLCRVEVAGKNANYVRTQLKKRIDARELDKQIEVSVVNNGVYLEKK